MINNDMNATFAQLAGTLIETAQDLPGAKNTKPFEQPDGMKKVDTCSANDISTKRTKQSMDTTKKTKTNDTNPKNVVAKESFDELLKKALGEVNEEFGDDDLGGGEDEVQFSGEVEDEGDDEMQQGGGSIEDLVSQLRSLVDQLEQEVLGGGEEDEESDFDDDFTGDEEADDDLGNVAQESVKGSSLGHVLKGMSRGKSLQSKANRVKSKQNKQGGKASKTAVNVTVGQTHGTSKSNLSSKGKDKTGARPGTTKGGGEDLF